MAAILSLPQLVKFHIKDLAQNYVISITIIPEIPECLIKPWYRNMNFQAIKEIMITL